MKKIISQLLTLQTLELDAAQKDSNEAVSLRGQIPSEMLSRFDKFIGRGKKGVAIVQNGVCKGCQIQVPIGVVNSLIQGATAAVCGNCGRYLSLSEADAVIFQARNKPEAVRVPKTSAPSLHTKSIRPSKAQRAA